MDRRFRAIGICAWRGKHKGGWQEAGERSVRDAGSAHRGRNAGQRPKLYQDRVSDPRKELVMADITSWSVARLAA